MDKYHEQLIHKRLIKAQNRDKNVWHLSNKANANKNYEKLVRINNFIFSAEYRGKWDLLYIAEKKLEVGMPSLEGSLTLCKI